MGNQTNATIYQLMEDGKEKDIIQKHTEDSSLEGRFMTINGKQMLNFGSCGYLGIEFEETLKEGARKALDAYGTQFSSSRAYLSIGLVKEVEDKMEELFGQPVIITASTTMGHLATLPVIVEDEDAVILDMQAHTSIQMAVQLLKARGINITIIRHNDMDALEAKVAELKVKHKKIWYMADGVYSMYGDFAPLDRLQEMLNTIPEFHLYIDDAHGMGWTGENGTGYVRSQIAHHERMVMATSMNKSFAAAGGCMIFPNEEMRKRVLHCGGTLIFSGPIQPPMLGVALASARLHLSPEITRYQQKLAELTAHMNQRLNEAGLPQFMETESPLFFIPLGLPRVVSKFVKRMKQDGFWINAAAFPATPMKRGGLRFMTNGHLTKADIDALVNRIAVHFQNMLTEEGITCKEIARNFQIPEFELKTIPSQTPVIRLKKVTELEPVHKRTISHLDPVEWDALHASNGTLSHTVLQSLESVFAKGDSPENQWDFHYFQVKDDFGKTVLSTFYTAVLVKDDMFAPAAVSEVIEKKRKSDPLFLNSKVVMLGSMITKGQILFVDREHPQWKMALQMLIDQMQETVAKVNAAQLMLREFYGQIDEELRKTMLEMGFTALQLPNNVSMQLGWKSQEEYEERLSGRYRSDLRREILKFEDQFEVVTSKPAGEEELQDCYQLYLNVFERSFQMNVHQLPLDYFRMMRAHDSFDIIRLFLKDDPRGSEGRKPVGVMFSYFEKGTYHAMIVGIDYEFNQSTGVYKQALYQTAQRANDIGATHLDLAFTAELVKKKVGATPESCWAFIQIMDSFNLQVIESMGRDAKAS
ncbi:MAG: GNAT family N-acetyltransferase [Bacteroidia bacterium]|nr:GNAT family N-acetyltransferase [Bacteroidia bacterium]